VIMGASMTPGDRDRGIGASPSPAFALEPSPPPVVPGCAGTTRAPHASSAIRRVSRGLPRQSTVTLWDVYTAPKGQVRKILALYNRSLRDSDHYGS